MRPEKDVSIMIEQWPDGWHVVVYVDGVSVERSPPFPDRGCARRKAKVVAEKFESKFGNWKKV